MVTKSLNPVNIVITYGWGLPCFSVLISTIHLLIAPDSCKFRNKISWICHHYILYFWIKSKIFSKVCDRSSTFLQQNRGTILHLFNVLQSHRYVCVHQHPTWVCFSQGAICFYGFRHIVISFVVPEQFLSTIW